VRRALAVYAAALAVLAVLAGDTLLRPSANNHYVHMAQGWLDGRLALPGPPPGYPRAHDDWGRVTTLHLRSGEILRASPCRTRACEARRREARVDTWRTLQGDLRELPRGAIARREDAWYVTFPPAPALLMLPGVALLGLAFPDVLFTVLLAAAIPAVLVHLLDRLRGVDRGRGREHLWLAAAWTLASPACFVGAHGSVWFTAQIVGALALTLHLDAAWRARRPLLAGLLLGLAAAARPPIALALPFFLVEWWRAGRSLAALLRFALPLALIAGACMLLNWLRFADPFEFGHRFLDIRWQERIQELGAFSLAYLPRNLACMVWLWPHLTPAAPYARASIHGLGLLFGAPWLLLLPLASDPLPQRRALLGAALLVAVPALLYHNTGQLQFTYRFALDWLPLVLIAFGAGGGARSRLFPPLVVLAALIELHGAWWFHRAPGHLFVADPTWPFPPGTP